MSTPLTPRLPIKLVLLLSVGHLPTLPIPLDRQTEDSIVNNSQITHDVARDFGNVVGELLRYFIPGNNRGKTSTVLPSLNFGEEVPLC